MAWEEVIGLRNRTCKTFVDDLNPLKRLLQTQVGISKHYQDDVGAWQDVDDTAEEPDTGGFTLKFTKLSYFGRVDGEGRRRFYPDRNDLSCWIEFKKPYPNMGTPTRQDRWFYWDFAHAVIGVRFDVDSLKFGFRLKDNQAPTSITIPFETQGITRQGRLLLHDGEVVAELRKPIATGSNVDAEGMPAQKECDVIFAPGEVTISLDPTGLAYPIEIDPTIDKQVGADADDTCCYAGGFQHTQYRYGRYNANLGILAARFTAVTIPLGATIDVAYISLYGREFWGTPEGKVSADDQVNPPAPINCTEINAITKTTAQIDWDGTLTTGAWNNSPSLVSVIQELVNSYDYSAGSAMQIVVDNDKGSGIGLQEVWNFGADAPHAAKLHIEYSVAVAGVPTHADNYMRRRVVQG